MYQNVEFKVCECAISNKDEVKVGHTYALTQKEFADIAPHNWEG